MKAIYRLMLRLGSRTVQIPSNQNMIRLLLLLCTGLNASGANLLPGFENCPWYLEFSAEGKTGSGFVLFTSNHVFLVTAKHVLFDMGAKTNPLPLIGTNLLAVGWSDQQRTKMNINLGAYHDVNQVRYSEKRDVAVVLFATRDLQNPNQWGYDTRFVRIDQATNTTPGMSLGVEVCRRYSDVHVAEDIYTFGYPTSVGSQLPNLNQLNPTRRLAKRGIIADKDPDRRRYVLDLSVYFGNSGGPVVAMRDTGLGSYENHLIGVVSEFVPFEDVWISQRYKLQNVTWGNSGYSIAEPIDHVLDLIW